MNTHVSIPIPTEQFLELVAFLRDQGSERDPVLAVSDAIEYWISNASWKQEDLLPDALVSRGYNWKYKDSYLFLPHGTDIRMEYKGETYYAKVDGDQIMYDGMPYSPASLVNFITKTSRNAWRDLWVKTPGRNSWLLADSCRTSKFIVEGKEIEL